MGVLGLLKDFSGWTSAHGIPQIGSARNIVVRIIWTVLYIGFLGIFGYNLYIIVAKFFKYGITVSTDIKFEERIFPAVTICNRNPYKNSILKTEAPELYKLMKDYEDILASPGGQIGGDDEYGFNNKSSSMDKMSLARIAMVYMAKGLSDEVWKKLTYDYNELIIECRFGDQRCNPGDFQKLKDPFYGACYTFNNMQPPKYSSSRGGSLFGLKLLVKADQDEFLPITETAAFRVTVHNQLSEPFPDAFGYNAAAGFLNNLGVKFTTTIRLQEPYGDCIADKSEVSSFFYSSSNYSMEACFRSCYQLKIIEKCKCADPRFASNGEAKFCQMKDMKCIEELGTVTADQCHCAQTCHDTTYGVTASQAYWPQKRTLPGVKNDTEHDCGLKDDTTNPTLKECQEWWSDNTMRIQVYYERLSYQQLKSNIAYSFSDIITDLGGQIGLWLGLSVITVIEFIGFSLLILCYCVAKKSGPQVMPDEHAADLDEIDEILAEERANESSSDGSSDDDDDDDGGSNDSDDSDEDSDDDDKTKE